MKVLFFFLFIVSSLFSSLNMKQNVYLEGEKLKTIKTDLKRCKYNCEIEKDCFGFSFSNTNCVLIKKGFKEKSDKKFTSGIKIKHDPLPAINNHIKELDNEILQIKLRTLNRKIEEEKYQKKQLMQELNQKNKHLKEKEQKEKELLNKLKNTEKKLNEFLLKGHKNEGIQRIRKELERKAKKEKELEKKISSMKKELKEKYFLEQKLKNKDKELKAIKTKKVVNNKKELSIEDKKIISRYIRNKPEVEKGICSLYSVRDKRYLITEKCSKKTYSNPLRKVFKFGEEGRPFVFVFSQGEWVFLDEGDKNYMATYNKEEGREIFKTPIYKIEYVF